MVLRTDLFDHPEIHRNMRLMLKSILEFGRYLFVLPVIGALILTVTVVIRGLLLILFQEWELLRTGQFSSAAAKLSTIAVIQIIDMFLVAAICYIIAIGFYRLFISREEGQYVRWIKIEKLADLENKIIGMVVVALGISFLGKAVETTDLDSLLYPGVGIAFVIGALCLFTRFSMTD